MAKKEKFDEFVGLLQRKSNEYFFKINAGAFTGEIEFIPKLNEGPPQVVIALKEDDKLLYKPNQSLETSMHISILFAISELAREHVDESFPMIFDAPTSSFGETKTVAFLNIISDTNNQIILLLKDFITYDKETNSLSIKQEFGQVKRDKALWVRVERPFDRLLTRTINTEVITL
jgi:DNA sulfur modification protein DndD